jgi:hypothetical protein
VNDVKETSERRLEVDGGEVVFPRCPGGRRFTCFSSLVGKSNRVVNLEGAFATVANRLTAQALSVCIVPYPRTDTFYMRTSRSVGYHCYRTIATQKGVLYS